MKRILVTGGAGAIAYSLLFRLARGELLGDQPIALHLLDVEPALKALEGVKMELDDCAFPYLKEVVIGTDPEKVFEGIDYAFLVGAKPRGPGMQRKDLLSENGKIFAQQGKALGKSANRDVKVLVIGNPCNTNCLITLHNAKPLQPKQFFAMTMLDENRARSLLALKMGVSVTQVTKVGIWGNHSATQVPNFLHAEIDGKKVAQLLDRSWLEGEFFSGVQERGAKIIEARGKSSAASAASSAIDAMRRIVGPSDWFSMGIYSQNNPYGIDQDLVFSYPCKNQGGSIQIIEGLKSDSFIEEKIKETQKELIEEREMIRHLL